jgi:hypothetical protein
MLKAQKVLLLSATGLVAGNLALAWWTLRSTAAPRHPPDPLFQQFAQQVWPLLTRGGEDSCVGCHDAQNNSDLHFFPDARSSFGMLVENNYFALGEPDALLGRLTTTHPKKQMPKGRSSPRWTEPEIERLRTFATNLLAHYQIVGQPDERFPSALRLPYDGPVPAALDNQFISYRQLRGKIKTVFGDGWVRRGRDLFQEHIALFGGADFKERFNESTKASATFLTGLDMLARDVASRAYTMKTGPFAGRAERLPSPLDTAKPDATYKREISRLYQTLLFRAPTATEMEQSFALLKNVYRTEDEIRAGDFELSFDLIVEDPQTGLKATRAISIPVSAEPLGLYQEFVNQATVTKEAEEPADEARKSGKQGRKVSGKVQKHTLGRTFLFKPGEPAQRFRLGNVNTVGNVSFHAIEFRLDGSNDTNEPVVVTATNSLVQAEGAWKLEDRQGLASFEDENNDKGRSTITVPIRVPREGRYALTVAWRQHAENASNVLVEVFSHDDSVLAKPALPPVPPAGEAHFVIDETVDTIAFADLEASFQFGAEDYVELNNRGTTRRVTADAVKFVSSADGKSLLVDNDEADGREQWQELQGLSFEAYNKVGKNSYTDDNQRKGELVLRYRPALKTNEWQPDSFYGVQVGYAAKADHETRAPVIVRARRSSPIIQVVHPAHARAETTLEIEASASYTVHGSALKFRWEQTGGPAVKLADPASSVARFVVPRQDMQQVAWESLCRALLRHPDFVFTRPPSVEHAKSMREKQRLQLVKLAQDLVGRPPNPAELERLSQGATLERMVEAYLQSAEFKDFYFHRVRLYLESHGTELQDEPARLWCYVAFNDLPFQEILTADYTVDAAWQKQPRPTPHGKTGVLTTQGFIDGKPGLPHFNYAAQVAELFLGYVFEVPPEIVAQRDGITAAATTDPSSVCYSCHKILTPLAYQRARWDDQGRYREQDEEGKPIDDSDQRLVASYPFPGSGMEAFATQAVRKERFIRTMINTHFHFFYGREMRWREDERVLYRRVWDAVHQNHFTLRSLLKAILLSPEYLEGRPQLKLARQAGRAATPVATY